MAKRGFSCKLLLVITTFVLALVYTSWSALYELSIGVIGDELECGIQKAHTSIGLFVGSNSLTYEPPELKGIHTVAAWPVANPLITPQHVSFNPDAIGSPTLWVDNEQLYMFFETISCPSDHRSVVAAVSYNDGLSWHVLGAANALGSPAHEPSKRPSLFRHDGTTYMILDSNTGLQLYEATKFPLDWVHKRPLLNSDPVHGGTVIQDPLSSEQQQRWLLLGSMVTSEESGAQERVVYTAASPLSEWTQLQRSNAPVSHNDFTDIAGEVAFTHATAPGGTAFITDSGELVRAHKTCNTRGKCTLYTFNVTATDETFTENIIDMSFGESPSIGQSEAWNHAGYRSLSAVKLPSGVWVAASAGSSPGYQPPSLNWQVALSVAFTKVLAVLCGIVMLFEAAAAFSIHPFSRNKAPPSLLPTIKQSKLRADAEGRIGLSPHFSHQVNMGGFGSFNDGGSHSASTTPRASDGPLVPDDSSYSPLSYLGGGGMTFNPIPLTKRSSAGASTAAMLAEAGAATAAAMANGQRFDTSPLTSPSYRGASSAAGLRHTAFGGIMSSGGGGGGISSRGPSPLGTIPSGSLPPDIHPSGGSFTSYPTSGSRSHAKGRRRRNAALAGLAMLAAFGVAAAAHHFRSVAAPFWQPSYPVLVQGHYSKFTLMVMSHEARMKTLRWYVKHYSTCSSVGEILIVWNQGTPPEISKDFPTVTIPLRIRIEDHNSVNNRYRPDPQISYRAVLSLDDDILMPCADVERAFALWRLDPSRLVGFYPRLAEPRLVREDGKLAAGIVQYHGEPEAIHRGRYNMILSGAAFIDSQSFFPQYWREELAPARELVDELHNCDDILMNFVVANSSLLATSSRSDPNDVEGGVTNTEGGGDSIEESTNNGEEQQQQQITNDVAEEDVEPPIQYVRAQRRLDVSHFTGVGISHDAEHFISDANECLVKFQTWFGRLPLRAQQFDWSTVEPPVCNDANVLDCRYHQS